MAFQEYIHLMENFLEDKINIQKFENEYHELYSNDEQIPETISELLYDFFTELDCYHVSHTEEDEKKDPNLVTEKTLRKIAATTLEKLKKLKA